MPKFRKRAGISSKSSKFMPIVNMAMWVCKRRGQLFDLWKDLSRFMRTNRSNFDKLNKCE